MVQNYLMRSIIIKLRYYKFLFVMYNDHLLLGTYNWYYYGFKKKSKLNASNLNLQSKGHVNI